MLQAKDIAKMLYVYDLDSLIFLSTDVAEAEITRSYDINLIDVKITLVHKGGLKKGETVAVHADGYRKRKKDDPNAQPLAVGDRLVVSVARAA